MVFKGRGYPMQKNIERRNPWKKKAKCIGIRNLTDSKLLSPCLFFDQGIVLEDKPDADPASYPN